jgi:hypothetical protein
MWIVALTEQCLPRGEGAGTAEKFKGVTLGLTKALKEPAAYHFNRR